ncbi:MAG: LacI family DNA-binding transcriptional regulator, partial [Oscillospiraceae bacterium]|nr:LacI family DNA-binding transcriptional regulator [Oscillospiraceae bacterium]
MTLKDIARLAGVSPSTVSRVLNQPDSTAASPGTRDRIWKIVRESGYIPNQNARLLRMGEESGSLPSRSLCCIFARSDEMMNDPFFSR